MLTNKTQWLLSYSYIMALLFTFSATSIADSNNDRGIEERNKSPIEQATNSTASGFSVYGNWCGPGHPADINNASDPIDLLDQQCKTHDLCYVDKGDLDCSCDRAMVKEIDKTQHYKLYTAQQYFVAQNIKIHFAISPCNGKVEGNKMLPTRVLTKVYKGTKRRVLNTYDRFIGQHFPTEQELENVIEKDAADKTP